MKYKIFFFISNNVKVNAMTIFVYKQLIIKSIFRDVLLEVSLDSKMAESEGT